MTASGTLSVTSDEEVESQLTPSQQAELADLQANVASIEKSTKDGIFDYSVAVQNGVDANVAREWAQGVYAAGGVVAGAPADLAASAKASPRSTRAVCRGQNKIWTDILGVHARLSSCVVPKVVSALQAGAGAATLAATIATAASLGVGAVTAIVPAVMHYSAWSIDACSKNGTGVELALSGFVCWAQ